MSRQVISIDTATSEFACSVDLSNLHSFYKEHIKPQEFGMFYLYLNKQFQDFCAKKSIKLPKKINTDDCNKLIIKKLCKINELQVVFDVFKILSQSFIAMREKDDQTDHASKISKEEYAFILSNIIPSMGVQPHSLTLEQKSVVDDVLNSLNSEKKEDLLEFELVARMRAELGMNTNGNLYITTNEFILTQIEPTILDGNFGQNILISKYSEKIFQLYLMGDEKIDLMSYTMYCRNLYLDNTGTYPSYKKFIIRLWQNSVLLWHKTSPQNRALHNRYKNEYLQIIKKVILQTGEPNSKIRNYRGKNIKKYWGMFKALENNYRNKSQSKST